MRGVYYTYSLVDILLQLGNPGKQILIRVTATNKDSHVLTSLFKNKKVLLWDMSQQRFFSNFSPGWTLNEPPMINLGAPTCKDEKVARAKRFESKSTLFFKT